MQKLVFIYNAKSDYISEVRGFFKKILSPQKYECDLCKLTYGTFSIKSDWRGYLASLPYEKIFLHKDDLKGKYEEYKDYNPPSILTEIDGKVTELVSKKDFKSMHSVQEIIVLLNKQLV